VPSANRYDVASARRYALDTGWLKVDNSDIQAVWGNITGTLSNQSDLQAALDAKITGGAGSNERIVFWTGANSVSSDSLFVYSSQRVGIGTASPSARLHLKTSAPGPALTLDLPTGASYESMYFMKAQNTNDYGVYQKLLGGATSSTARGYFGFAHTGTGGDTILTGELADSLCLRAQGALHLAASGDASSISVPSANRYDVASARRYALDTGGVTPPEALPIILFMYVVASI